MIELLFAVIKVVGYAAALTGAGVCLSQATVFRTLMLPAALIALVRTAGAALALAAVCSALIYVLRLGSGFDSAAVDAVLGSSLGISLACQCLGGLWLLCVMPGSAAYLAVVPILMAYAVVGHSATHGLLSSFTVLLHVAAVAWWAGGLWILLHAVSAGPPERLKTLLSRFSRCAPWVVALLVLGAGLTALQLLEYRYDAGRDYDRGLLVKAVATVGLLSLAGLNRRVFAPQDAERPRSITGLRFTVLAELALMACILALTSWLTTYRSPHDLAHQKPGAASGQVVEVLQPWGSEMPGGVGNGAGYFIIVNHQTVADRLLSANSPWAEHVRVHRSTVVQGVSRMRDEEPLVVPAGGRMELAPGGHHLMFTGLVAPFVAGDVVPVTLTWEHAGRVEVTLEIRPIGGLPSHVH